MLSNEADGKTGQNPARKRRATIAGVLGLFVLVLGVPPLINALSNPRLATLHGPVLQLVAVGLCLGMGVTLLVVGLVLRGE